LHVLGILLFEIFYFYKLQMLRLMKGCVHVLHRLSKNLRQCASWFITTNITKN